ncbi:unnamed protein product [Agarophyton chilense]
MQKRNSVIRVEGHVFVRVERPEKQDKSRQKLLPKAAGRYKTFNFNGDTVLIDTSEKVEHVSRDRVVVAPDMQEQDHLSSATGKANEADQQGNTLRDSSESEPPPVARAEEKSLDLSPPEVLYANHRQPPKCLDIPLGTRTHVKPKV